MVETCVAAGRRATVETRRAGLSNDCDRSERNEFPTVGLITEQAAADMLRRRLLFNLQIDEDL